MLLNNLEAVVLSNDNPRDRISYLSITLMKEKVSKGAKIRNRYNQVPHLTQDTNGKVTSSQLDTTNKSQEVSPFPAGNCKAHINRRIQKSYNFDSYLNISYQTSMCLDPHQK